MIVQCASKGCRNYLTEKKEPLGVIFVRLRREGKIVSQAICTLCWRVVNGDREPIRVPWKLYAELNG